MASDLRAVGCGRTTRTGQGATLEATADKGPGETPFAAGARDDREGRR